MSSVLSNDRSCMLTAENMSCTAVHDMNARYNKNNATLLNYSVGQPNLCERYHHISDKQLEHTLQAGGGLVRNMCWNTPPNLSQGDYAKQFAPIRPVPEIFLMSTKQKTRTSGM